MDTDIIFSRRGFTIIEILVVLAIIGILSAVLYSSFFEARQDAKNKAFRSDLKEVQLALEVYKSQHGQYPNVPTGPSVPSGCGNTDAGVSTAESTLCPEIIGYIGGLTPEFIAVLPAHKKSANPNCNVVYSVDAVNFSWYKVTAENCFAGATSAANGINQNDEFARCPTVCAASGVCDPTGQNFYESYAVYSRGGECQ